MFIVWCYRLLYTSGGDKYIVQVLKVSPNCTVMNCKVLSCRGGEFGTINFNTVAAGTGAPLRGELGSVCGSILAMVSGCGPSRLSVRGLCFGAGSAATVSITRTHNIVVLTTGRQNIGVGRCAPLRIGRTIANCNETRGRRIVRVMGDLLSLGTIPGPSSATSTLTVTVYRNRCSSSVLEEWAVVTSLHKGLVCASGASIIIRYVNMNFGYTIAGGALCGLPRGGRRIFLRACVIMERSDVSLCNFASVRRLRAFGLVAAIDNINPGVKLTLLSRFSTSRVLLCVTDGSPGTLASTDNINLGLTRQVMLRLGSGVNSLTNSSVPSVETTKGTTMFSGSGRTITTLISLNCARDRTSLTMNEYSRDLPASRLVGATLGALTGKVWVGS